MIVPPFFLHQWFFGMFRASEKQELHGIWKVGLYADIAKEFNLSDYIPFQFEHENITEAESVIERRQRQIGHKKYVVKDYYSEC